MMVSKHKCLVAGYSTLAVLLVVAMLGCDDVPTFKEITGQDDQQQPAQNKTNVTPQKNSKSVTQKIVPTKRTDAQIISEFKEMPPARIKDKDLNDLLAVSSGLDQIESLDLSRSEVSAKGLQGVEKLANVTSVNVDRAQRFDDAALSSISKMPAVTSLVIEGTPVSGSGLQQLASMPHLEILSIGHMVIGDDDISILSKLPNLRELGLTNTKLTDAGFVHIANLPALEKLDVSFTQIDGSGFEELKGLKSLKEINASDTKFGPAGFNAIRAHRQLERLAIAQCNLKDDSVMHAKSLTNLKHLHLGQNFISNRGMAAFRGMRDLETLNLYNNRSVSDIGVSNLKNLKNLKDLNIDGTLCTGKAVEGMKHFVPDIKVKLQGKYF